MLLILLFVTRTITIMMIVSVVLAQLIPVFNTYHGTDVGVVIELDRRLIGIVVAFKSSLELKVFDDKLCGGFISYAEGV